jgi:hypothetical protein
MQAIAVSASTAPSYPDDHTINAWKTGGYGAAKVQGQDPRSAVPVPIEG